MFNLKISVEQRNVETYKAGKGEREKEEKATEE